MIRGRIRKSTGQAARLVNLFCDVRAMGPSDFHQFLASLDDYRIRDAIMREIGDDEEHSDNSDRYRDKL